MTTTSHATAEGTRTNPSDSLDLVILESKPQTRAAIEGHGSERQSQRGAGKAKYLGVVIFRTLHDAAQVRARPLSFPFWEGSSACAEFRTLQNMKTDRQAKLI